jgi:hypothetical protein
MFLLIGLFCDVKADISPEVREQLEEESFQRRVEGFYDMQYNKISNMEFTVTNTGTTFYDQKLGRGTGIWPRGSMNCYIFGGGIWVGSKKRNYIKYPDPDNPKDSIYKLVVDSVYEYTKWDRENLLIVGNDTTLKAIPVKDTVWSYERDTVTPHKLVAVTYNPNSAKSFMVPGRISDGDNGITTDSRSYRVYFSLDYNSSSGEPLVAESGPSWPIWDVSDDTNKVLKYDRYFGFYEQDQKLRNTAKYPRGPAFISGEDIFSTYKDTDLTKYGDFGGVAPLIRKGYPQRIQYEQMIYSWGFGDYRDFIFIKYDQINTSNDTIWDMWLAPVFDVDITLSLNYQAGAANDRTCFYGMEGRYYPTLPVPEKARRNMAYQYSMGTAGETGRGFGYCGFVFLESPAIIEMTRDVNQYAKDGENPVLLYYSDSVGFVRKEGTWLRTDPVTGLIDTCYPLADGSGWYYYHFDGTTKSNKMSIEKNIKLMRNVPWYPVAEQLGLCTFRNWPITEDKKQDEVMYDFIQAGWHDGPVNPGDMRYMMATGPFHMRPGDTSRTVVGLVIAATGKGGDADGTDEDLMELVRKVDFMQKVYDENFRSPQPPYFAVINSWEPLNNGMVINWDSTSELSSDPYEKGMNFLGYRIYRARRLNLDTFDVNNIASNSLYPSGKGPFGWKEIASFQMPTPFVKSSTHSERTEGSGPTAQTFMGMDSLMPIGPYYRRDTTYARDTVWKDDNTVDSIITRIDRIDTLIDLQNILCIKVPRGVNIYPPYLLDNARRMYLQDNTSKLGKLEAAGWYDTTDKRYSFRISGIINSIDSANWPWGKYLYNKNEERNTHNFEDKALLWKPDRTGGDLNYVLDSAMFVRLELNPALAQINPLFYYPMRVQIDPETDRLFYELDDSGKVKKTAAHWITRDSVDENGNPVLVDGQTVKTLIKVDTLYELGSEQITTVNNRTVLTINTMLLRDSLDWLKTLEHYNMVVDSIYRYFELGWVKQIHSANFTPDDLYATDFAGSDEVKRRVIIPTMDSVTNHRRFVDVGDDPEPGSTGGNAFISKLDNPEKTENLYNNVEYYYKVVAFDEGDFLQPTPRKNNVGLEGLSNLVKTYPASAEAGKRVDFKVIGTEGALGGLHNFNLFAIDEERVAQLFAGDTLELEFEPTSLRVPFEITHKPLGAADTNITSNTFAGTYYTKVKLTNKTKGIKLLDVVTGLETTPCEPAAATTWVDNAVYRTTTDSVSRDTVFNIEHYVDLGYPGSRQSYDVATVQFTSGDFREDRFCYSLQEENEMWGNIGVSFNAALKQYGGVYRGDSVDLMNTNVTTRVTPLYFSELGWESKKWYTDTNYSKDYPNRIPLFGGNYGMKKSAIDFSEIWINTPSEYVVSSFRDEDVYNIRFDNGPGVYEVEFLQGGEEELELKWANNADESKKFRARYLNMKVTDTYSYNRFAPDIAGVDSVEIRYPSDIPFMELPIQPYPETVVNNQTVQMCTTPSPINLSPAGIDPGLFYRKYNLYANGYVGARSGRKVQQSMMARRFVIDEKLVGDYGGVDQVHFVGEQGRYYLTAVSEDGQDTVDFVHTMNIAGAQFVLAYLQRGNRSNGKKSDDIYISTSINDTIYGADFKVGDKIKFISWGGVSGFPEKGAKVRFAITNPSIDYTDDILDEIKVVPNPYVITHQNQPSAYGGELYFTKLPPVCTIDIFSAAGDLITTLDHNELTDGDRKRVEIYDLLTKNGQRVQSQTLIALIKTPNGAMTTKHFSIIVGGFRVVE